MNVKEYFEYIDCNNCNFREYCGFMNYTGATKYVPDSFCSCIPDEKLIMNIDDFLYEMYQIGKRNDER